MNSNSSNICLLNFEDLGHGFVLIIWFAVTPWVSVLCKLIYFEIVENLSRYLLYCCGLDLSSGDSPF